MTEVLANVDLARAMIEVHGNHAASVARENARAAAVAGQVAPARNWLKVVEAIQRHVPGTESVITRIAVGLAPRSMER